MISRKYFFGFSLSDEADAYVRLIAEDLYNTFGVTNIFTKYIPHITVKVPFTGHEHDQTILEEFMQKFVRGRKPIPIQIKGFGHFNIGTVYCDILQHGEDLTLLQSELCYGLEDIPWVTFDVREPTGIPHITVGAQGIRGRFIPIFEHLQQKYHKGRYMNLEKLNLFQKLPHTESWEIAATGILK